MTFLRPRRGQAAGDVDAAAAAPEQAPADVEEAARDLAPAALRDQGALAFDEALPWRTNPGREAGVARPRSAASRSRRQASSTPLTPRMHQARRQARQTRLSRVRSTVWPGMRGSATPISRRLQRPAVAQRRNWREMVSGLPKRSGRSAQRAVPRGPFGWAASQKTASSRWRGSWTGRPAVGQPVGPARKGARAAHSASGSGCQARAGEWRAGRRGATCAAAPGQQMEHKGNFLVAQR